MTLTEFQALAELLRECGYELQGLVTVFLAQE